MNWLRKLTLSAVLAVATISPLAVTPAAQANPNHGQYHVYYVYYRNCAQSPWTCYGGYYNHHDAHRAVEWFRHSGYDAFYR